MLSLRTLTVGLATSVAALGAATGVAAATRPTPPLVRVSINPTDRLATVGPDAFGVDTPFWNGHLTDRDTVARIRQAGIRLLDFDAGGPTDLYDWQTNSLLPDPDAARDRRAGDDWETLKPRWSFDRFEQVARDAGVQTTVHVNYGTGTPQLAAAWVRDANVVHHDDIRDWMIGEEVWLDQFVEPNARVPSTLRSPEADAEDYGRNVIAFAQAMKAVDPSIRIGIEGFAVPPQVAQHSKELQYFVAWTRALIATPGLTRAADYIDIHYLGYASTLTQAYELDGLLPEEFGGLRAELDAQPGGRHMQIIAGEVNSAGVGKPWLETQGNADYLADTELSLLEHGVSQTHWYSLYNGPDGPLTDDFGLLSSGVCIHTPRRRCEPRAGQPFAPFWAQRLVSEAAPTGASLVSARSSSSTVGAYAARVDGRLRVLLVNRSARPVRARTSAFARRTLIRQAASGHGITTRHAGAVVTLPPYSVSLITG